MLYFTNDSVLGLVKTRQDGDESADDLDESHTSYSEMSYSRTTDVDRDQESSASEDTLNITVQDNGQAQAFVNQSSSFIPVQKGGQNISYDPSSRQQGNQALPQVRVSTFYQLSVQQQ